VDRLFLNITNFAFAGYLKHVCDVWQRVCGCAQFSNSANQFVNLSLALQLKFVYVNPFAKFEANFLFAAGF
jgi:hypothetical protein